jgi:hypothetical protein
MIPTMIEIDGKIVSTDIITEKFLCDLASCRGICCVEGNAGAPLEAGEARILADEAAAYRPFMTAAGVAAVERQGFGVIDSDGDLVTPLVGDAECAYSYNEDGVTLCAIEKAWVEGGNGRGDRGHAKNDRAVSFRKPVSCHLYPIRVTRFGDGSLGLNYHRWAVCEGARAAGRERGVPMFRMLREAIVRRFGEEFFAALEAAEAYLSKE